MIEYEVGVPPEAGLSNAEHLIEACCAAEGLRIATKGSLAKHPGCVHWHLKQGTGPGTLEITFCKEPRRIWLAVHANRTAPWIDRAAMRIKHALEQSLAAVYVP